MSGGPDPDDRTTENPEKIARRRADGLMAQMRGRRNVLVGTAISLWLLSVLAIPFMPERYTATSSLFVGPDDRLAITTGETAPIETSRIESEMAIIASRTLAERVIGHLKLQQDPDLNPGAGAEGASPGSPSWIPGWARRLLTGAAPTALDPETGGTDRTRARMVGTFLERLQIERQGQSRVVEIAFTAASPQRAADIANALAETYVIDKAEKTFNRSKRASEWMAKRLSELRRLAEKTEGAVKAQRHNLSLNRKANAKRDSEIANLRQSISERAARRVKLKGTLDRTETLLRAGRIGKAVAALSSNRLRRVHAYIESLQREFSTLSRQVDPGDRQVIHLRDEIRAAKTQFKGEVDRVIQGLRNEINVSLAKENSQRFSLSRLEQAATADAKPASDRKTVSLKTAADANRALYQDFLSQIKGTAANFGMIDPTVRIISRADIPLVRSFPPLPEYLVITFGLAWLIGFIAVLIAASLDRGFRSLEQIERETGLPTLGLVPSTPRFGPWGANPEDYMLDKPISAYSEAIRSLNTGMLLSNIEAPPRLIMVTSASPNEGKTSLALSFARMVGRIGQKRVVIVDCDLRHPQVDHKLGLDRAPGLVEYLMDEASLEEVLQVDEQTNALVISAGRIPLNSIALLTSDRFKDLLTKLSEACDLVILDSSPVLAVSDSRVLARLVDQTIFVTRWAKTRQEVVKRAINEIQSAGSEIAGVVLTRVNVRQHARFDYSDSGVYFGPYQKYYSS